MREFFVYLYIAARDFVKYVWPALGPLIGVGLGAYLTGRRQKQDWLANNRKEECRELLTAITKLADCCMDARAKVEENHPAKNDAIQMGWAEDRKCLVVLHDRIFIAGRLNEEKLSTRLSEATGEFLTGGDRRKFGERLNEIKRIIVAIALKG